MASCRYRYAMLSCSLPCLSFLFCCELSVRVFFHRFAAAEARTMCLISPLDQGTRRLHVLYYPWLDVMEVDGIAVETGPRGLNPG